MLPEENKAIKYKILDSYLDLISKSLNLKFPNYLLSYSNKSIISRIKQQLTLDGQDWFMSNFNDESDIKNNNNVIDFGKFKFNLNNNKLHLSSQFFYKNVIFFVFLWILLLILFLLSLFVISKKNKKWVMIYGAPINNQQSIIEFEKFCDKQKKLPFSRENHYIVQTNCIYKSSGRFKYSRYPLFLLLLNSKLNFIDICKFSLQHIKVFINFIRCSFKNNELSVLWRDFSFHSVIKHLDSKNIISSFVLTNTNWFRQFIWQSDLKNRSFKSFMIPYSMNVSPLEYKKSKITNYPQPGLKQLRVDELWVWSNEDIVEFKKLGINSRFKIKKPILWYLDKNFTNKSTKNFVISIFDVTPMSHQKLSSRGVNKNYYSFNTMKKFIKDIVNICSQLSIEHSMNISLSLKPKRNFSSYHDLDYIQFIEDLKNNNLIKVLNQDGNLFSIIRNSNLVISIPFSSPSYIARTINIKSIFYDPTDSIRNNKFKNKGIKFISDKILLKQFIGGLVSKYKTY
jgi:polysaccharide biosynthesis PFTS motif protein